MTLILALVCLALVVIVARQAQRIHRLNRRLDDQGEAAIKQTLKLHRAETECGRLAAENTIIRGENVKHLRLEVEGRAS